MTYQTYEIERKFLVKSIPTNLDQYQFNRIKQAYISTNPTIRIRQKDDEYILTVKGTGTIKKIELELELNESQFNNLKTKVEGNTIEKIRYKIPIGNSLIAELDIYEGNLAGFCNVEVEFSSTKSAILFQVPDWFGQEVTQDLRYSNAYMAKNGIPVNKL